MTNEETLSQMIAGTLLIQELLIRDLEAKGVLKRGEFGATLQAWMEHRVEQYLGPENAAAKAATLKALDQAEAGWKIAINRIGERAGLTKTSDGTWSAAA